MLAYDDNVFDEDFERSSSDPEEKDRQERLEKEREMKLREEMERESGEGLKRRELEQQRERERENDRQWKGLQRRHGREQLLKLVQKLRGTPACTACCCAKGSTGSP